MKKSELTQLTQLIEHLVEREVKKQLPKLIGEVFQNMAGKAMVTEHVVPTPMHREYVGKQVEQPKPDPQEFKSSLKELFQGVTPVTRSELEERLTPQPSPPKKYTNNPVLNEILNATVPLRQYEKMRGMGMYAATADASAPVMAPTGVGEMMAQAEMPSFAKSMVSGPSMSENHIPMAAMPEGMSALDIAKVVTPAPVAKAMTDFSRMKAVLEASKKRR